MVHQVNNGKEAQLFQSVILYDQSIKKNLSFPYLLKLNGLKKNKRKTTPSDRYRTKVLSGRLLLLVKLSAGTL